MSSGYETNMEGPPSKKQRSSSPAPPTKFDSSDWNLLNEFNSELPDELGNLGGSNVTSTNAADSGTSSPSGNGSSSSSSKKADDTIQRNINLSLLLSSNNDPRAPVGSVSLPQQISSSAGHMNLRYPMSQHPQHPHQQQQQQQQQQMMMMYQMQGQRQGFGPMQHAGGPGPGGFVGNMNSVYARSPVAASNYPLRHPDFVRQKSLPAPMSYFPDDVRTIRMNGNVFPHADPMAIDRGFGRSPFPMRNEGAEMCNPNIGAGAIGGAVMQAKMPNGLTTTTMSRVLPCGNGKSLVPASANLQATCNLTDAKAAMPKSGSTVLPTGKMGVLSPETNVFPISPAAPPETTMEGPPAPPPSMAVINPEKRREVQEVQQKLVLLLHAHKCQRKDQTNGAISFICHVTGCSSMKTLLKHMTECQEGKSCKVQHCAALRQIITHWKNCDRPDCPICSPLKNRRTNSQTAPNKSSGSDTSVAPTPATQVMSGSASTAMSKDEMTRTYETLGLDPNNHLQRSITNSSLQGPPGVGVVVNPGKLVAAPLEPGGGGATVIGNAIYDTSSKPTKDWHHSVVQDLRNHLIHKLVQAIFPTPDPTILKNDRMNNVVQYAKKVEGDMYETASSREEYYLLLAEKIYKIQKELEEKRMKRMIDTGNTPGAVAGFVHGGSNDSQVDSGFSSPPLTSMYLMSQSPGGVSRLGNDIYSDMGPANPNMLRARGDPQFLGPRLGLDVYAKRMPQPPPGTGMPYGCQETPQPSNGQANRMIGPIDNQSHLTAVAPDLKQQSMTDAVFSRKDMVDPPKPDPLSSLPPNLQSLPPNARQPTATPPVSNNQPDVSFAETLNLQPACDSPREVIIGAKPGSVLPCVTGSSPVDQMPSGEKVAPALDPGKSSPFFKDAAEVVTVNQDPKSPKDFKYDTSTAHEDISDDEIVTVKPEVAPVEMKVEVKEEVMEATDEEAEKKRGATEMAEEATVAVAGVKAEGASSEECGGAAVVRLEASSSEGAENGTVAVSNGEADGEKPEVGRKVWSSEELLQALLPTWEKLYSLEPEAAPFRFPVNPVELGIPDYFEIVKNPIDLSTIRAKLETGEYSDPWQYVDDIGLMFDNAWLYNRKTSRVYKFCSKLAEVFEGEIDGVMQSLGFCCGRRHVFSPQVLCCFGKQLCAIPRDTIYYNYQDRYIYCEKCFNELNGDDIEMADDPSQPGLKIKKEQFVREKNDKLDRELFVDCQDCGRKMHKICVLYMEQVWPEGFSCKRCLKGKGLTRKENKYTAKRLPSTKLGTYLETRVNSLLKRKDAGAGEVTIRVLSSYDKAVEVKPGMKSRFFQNSNVPETFPYRVKAMFAFEEIDGIDVCFFGMHVQEYGSDCRPPNARRVYIAYLDSVHFFQPKQFRTMVYHEILIGYMDYVKTLGFQTAHIWACPPSEGDDYIFHCHPPDQKIPKPKRLQEWYKKMLDKALNDRVIFDYKDILKDAIDNSFQSVTEIPYFEGDFWPNILEECIKELEQEEVEKRLREEEEAAADTEDLEPIDRDSTEVQPVAGKKKGQKNNSNTKKKNTKNKKPSNRKSKSGLPHCGNDLTAKLMSAMEKHKEGFFVVRLQPTVEPHEIKDPDPLINCDLMDGRDAFLTLSRDKHYEFSSLRRAKFSTIGLLYELHTQAKDGFIYTCNDCKANVETRYHCSVCDDYDLCVPCYQTSSHPHKSKMTRLGLDLDEGSANDAKSQNSQEARRVSLQTYIQSLVHACHCRDANCHRTICQKMKRLVQHVRNCKRRQHNNSCPVCKQLLTLCWNHAKTCKETKCPVPFCTNMKQKLEQQHAEQQFKQNQLLRRRMAIMQRAPDADLTPQSAHQPTSDPPTPTTAMPHGYSAGGKFMHAGVPGCQSPSMMGAQRQMEMAGHRAMGPGGYLVGGGPMPGAMMHQRQFMGGPGMQMMDQGGMWQHEMYPGMQTMSRSHEEMMYAPQQHMMAASHGGMGSQACMPGMGMAPPQHAMDAMAGMQGGGVSQQQGPQMMGGASASTQMAMLLAKRMKAPGAGGSQMAQKDMVGFIKGNPQMMPNYMKQSQQNSEHSLGPSGVPMSSAAHMMDDMIVEDPNYAMGGHMSMMPNSMGGMRPMMVDQMGGQGAGAGRMASPQWIQHQQQMRCIPSEYQRYPSHMSQQGMGMYGGGGGGGLPPQVQRVRMNFGGGGGGGGGHPQGFPPGDGGMMAQYNHMQQQQQQQMLMHQKRMQLKSQMAAAASIRSGMPAGMQAGAPSQSIVSQQQQQQQRGLGQIQMDMQTTQTQQQQQQPSQQQQAQQQATVPQQQQQAQSQQPSLPCSLPSMASSAPGGGASGLRPTTQGLAKRAPSPRRPPPHYADTVSMQSMARMQRMMPGVMAPQHGVEMTGYGTEQSHLRFPMAPDYSQSLGGASMEGVQQFPSSSHSSLARFPNNMPQ